MVRRVAAEESGALPPSLRKAALEVINGLANDRDVFRADLMMLAQKFPRLSGSRSAASFRRAHRDSKRWRFLPMGRNMWPRAGSQYCWFPRSSKKLPFPLAVDVEPALVEAEVGALDAQRAAHKLRAPSLPNTKRAVKVSVLHPLSPEGCRRPPARPAPSVRLPDGSSRWAGATRRSSTLSISG